MKSKNLPFFATLRPSSVCAFIALGMSCLPAVSAAEVTWDTVPADAAITGGSGFWDLSTPNWTIDVGASNITWNNATNDTAVFGGVTGTVTLTEPVTAGGLKYNTNYSITANTLTLAGPTPTVTVGGGLTGTVSSIVAGSNGLTKKGAGTLTLSGASANTYTGPTTVNQGEIGLNFGAYAGNDLINSASPLILKGGALSMLLSANTARTQSFAGTTVSSGTSAVHINKGGSGIGLLDLGAITRDAGATLNIHYSHSGGANRRIQSSSWASAATITDNGVAYATFLDQFSSTGAAIYTANDWAAYTGTTVQAATYTNSTTTDLSGNATIASGVNTTLSADTVITTLRATAAQSRTITIEDGFSLTTGGILTASTVGGSTTTITGGTLKSAATAAGKDLVVFTHNTGTTAILSTIANADAGSTGLTKSGAGILRLGGANTFTGATFVNGGTLIAGTAASLANSPSVTMLPGSTLLAGYGAADGHTEAGIVGLLGKTTFGSSSSTFGFDTTGAVGGTASYGGNLALAPNLLKYGPGVLSLTSTNNYTGTTTVAVNGGVLLFATPQALYNGNQAAWTEGNLIINSGGGLGINMGGAGEFTLSEFQALTALGTANGGFLNNSSIAIDTTNAGGSFTIPSVIANPNAGANALGLIKLGTGKLTLTGDNTFTGPISVNSGTLEMAGNRTTNSGPITAGGADSQTGTLNLTNGTFAVAGGGNIVVGGNFATATGIINQTGGSLSTTTGLVLLGNAGATGTYNLSGGSLAANNNSVNSMILGVNTDGTGTFNLSGTGSLSVANLLQIGRSNNSAASNTTGIFNQTGGSATITNLGIGGGGPNNDSTSGTLNLSAGTFAVTGIFSQLSNGPNSSSQILIGGAADVSLPAFPTARGTGSTATITFDGGVLKPTVTSLTYMEGLDEATIQDGGATFDVDTGKDILINQALLTHPTSSGGGLTKLGTGTLGLGGTNTYTGTTTISAGSLVVDVAGSLDAASSVIVGTDGTLGGTGVANGSVTSSGTIAPGYLGVGTLTTGAATLTAGSLAIEVSGGTADKLQSTGNVNLAGATLTVTELAPGMANSFVIAQGTSVTGTFSTPALPGGYSLEYTATQVILKLAGEFGYNSWVLGTSLDGTNNGPNQDPDNDGIKNLMEYVLGGIPVGAGANDSSILPIQTLNATQLVFEYNRLDASKSDTTQVVQISTDLAIWTDFATIGETGGGAVSITPNGTAPDHVSVAIPRSNEVNGKLFARLVVSKP